MDKNIAALLREDAKTVHVTFEEIDRDFLDEVEERFVTTPAGAKLRIGGNAGPRLYTYVTHLEVKTGDTVVVLANKETKLATVVRVDSEVEIEPNSNVAYKWVIDKVDLVAYEENQQRNEEIEKTVSEAYRVNLRRSFAQTVLQGVEDSRREQLTLLLKGGAQ